MSILGSSSTVSAGAVNRFGPIVNRNGIRNTDARKKERDPVRILMPKKLMSTVSVSQAGYGYPLIAPLGGFGFANTGAMDENFRPSIPAKDAPTAAHARAAQSVVELISHFRDISILMNDSGNSGDYRLGTKSCMRC